MSHPLPAVTSEQVLLYLRNRAEVCASSTASEIAQGLHCGIDRLMSTLRTLVVRGDVIVVNTRRRTVRYAIATHNRQNVAQFREVIARGELRGYDSAMRQRFELSKAARG